MYEWLTTWKWWPAIEIAVAVWYLVEVIRYRRKSKRLDRRNQSTNQGDKNERN
jgi:hypothetical protein